MADVVIYTRPFCGYCSRALALLRRKSVTVTEIEAGFDPARRAEMVQKTGGRTFPQILVDGTPIGGCDELYALEEEGRLDGMLAA